MVQQPWVLHCMIVATTLCGWSPGGHGRPIRVRIQASSDSDKSAILPSVRARPWGRKLTIPSSLHGYPNVSDPERISATRTQQTIVIPGESADTTVVLFHDTRQRRTVATDVRRGSMRRILGPRTDASFDGDTAIVTAREQFGLPQDYWITGAKISDRPGGEVAITGDITRSTPTWWGSTRESSLKQRIMIVGPNGFRFE